MKHTMVTFRLHRKGVVLVALGSVLLGTLLFMAGCLAGQLRAAKAPILPSLPSVPTTPAVPAIPPIANGKQQSEPKDHIEKEAFALRVGAFADEEAAKAYVQELTARGHQPSVVAETTQGGVLLHTVRIGRYADRGKASEAASELARKEGISSAVVPAAPAVTTAGG
ncbi:MAG TPA: SPOR domain-containing protein [Thermoanaerobaculia bacterium]|nr:SPOR domain-containing protein [Thermoanaerobaculia bacterium]